MQSYPPTQAPRNPFKRKKNWKQSRNCKVAGGSFKIEGKIAREKIEKLRSEVQTLREAFSKMRGLKKEAINRITEQAQEKRRSAYDLMFDLKKDFKGIAVPRLDALTQRVGHLPSPTKSKPPKFGQKKTPPEERAERMKETIEEKREERRLENEFLEMLE